MNSWIKERILEVFLFLLKTLLYAVFESSSTSFGSDGLLETNEVRIGWYSSKIDMKRISYFTIKLTFG